MSSTTTSTPSRASRTRLLALATAVLVLAVIATRSGTGAAAVTVPQTGAYFGAYVQSYGGQSLVQSAATFEKSLGRKLAIVNKYHDFSMTNYSDEASFIKSGHIVMISWHPTDGPADPNRAKKIASGQYDSVIRAAANGMKALHGRVLLRWDFEMDQDPGQVEYIGPPAQFIAAWRHMYTIFQQVGATNVEWVWAPRAQSFKTGLAQSYYPGAAYVDWIGGSAVPEHNLASFYDIFHGSTGGFYAWASQQGKPLEVWVGVKEDPKSASWKAEWLSGLEATVKASMPKIKAVIYYNAYAPGGVQNYRANTSSQAWTAFRHLALDPYFKPMPAG